jgi:hypothetical protein
MFLPTSLFFYAFISVMADSLQAVVAGQPYHTEQWIELGYIFPHFTFGMILIEFLVDHGVPKLFFKAILPLNMEKVWLANITSIAFFLLLYIYLDAIIPNKYGVARSCCFCVHDGKRYGKELK